jgi:anti-anti-sigma factor
MVTAEQTEDGLVLHILGDLTQQNSAGMTAAVLKILHDHEPGTRVVLDVSRAVHIDSSGVGAVLEIGREAQASGIHLIVSGLSDSAGRAFKRTGISSLLTIVDGRGADPGE